MYRIPRTGSCVKTFVSIMRSHGLNLSYVHFPCFLLSMLGSVVIVHMSSTPLLLTYLDRFDPDILPYWSPMCMTLLSKPSLPSTLSHGIVMIRAERSGAMKTGQTKNPIDASSPIIIIIIISSLFEFHYARQWQTITLDFHPYGLVTFLQYRIDILSPFIPTRRSTPFSDTIPPRHSIRMNDTHYFQHHNPLKYKSALTICPHSPKQTHAHTPTHHLVLNSTYIIKPHK